MYQQVFSEEIKNARVEHLATVRVASNQKGTRKKTIPPLIEDYYPVVWIGTRQRRKEEVQHCSYLIEGQICGAVTVWHGYLTGHTGAHGHYGRNEVSDAV